MATSGIYSRTLTVPGAVVPCAGITWVTVAPTHRRRGVLTAIMRRQLTEMHEQEREPVAALWASEVPIYGRFGYAPAALPRRPDRPHRAAAAAAGRRPRHRAGRTGRPRRPTSPRRRPCYDAVRRFVPGNLARDERWWDRRLRDQPDDRDGATALRFLLHTETDGTVTGYAAWRMKGDWNDDTGEPDGTLIVEEVRAQQHPGLRGPVEGAAVGRPGPHA